MRRLWIGLAISLLMISSDSWARSIDPIDQQWNRTGIDFKSLKNYVENLYPCYHSPRSFLACVEMINSLGAHGFANKPAVRLGMTAGLDPASVIKTFGPYALYKYDVPKARDRFEDQQRRLNLLKSIALNWKEDEHPVDFLKLADERLGKSSKGNARAIGEAINSLLKIHDWHAEIGPAAQNSNDSTLLSAELTTDGIGVILDDDGQSPFIQYLYEGSPAAQGGLQIGDEIVGVDGKNTSELDSDSVVSLLLGKPGSSVTVEVQRANGERKTAKMKRAHFDTPDVVEHVVKDMERSVLHIMVSSFLDDQTCRFIDEDLQNYTDIDAIILDLRGNVGGLESQAQCVVGLFVGKKTALSVHQLGADGKVSPAEQMRAATNAQATNLPMVVLIDSQSASAAEIVAGALQDYQRAWIVGKRSYGKGTIQAVQYENPYLLSMKTVAEYFLPSGRGIQAVGVKPDFEVGRRPDEVSTKHVLREADYFPFSLPPSKANDESRRQGEIDSLNEHCLAAKRAENLFTTNVMRGLSADLQLYKGEEVLSCPFWRRPH